MNTSTQQPDPLQLAEWLDFWSQPTAKKAAAALRRLHAENLQLRADLEAVGAGGVGPLIPTTVQHQGESSGDNELQRKTGDLITTAAPPQSGGIPPDWKPVPLEPTDEMLQAFKRRYKEGDFWRARITGAVCAMLAAAPQPPGGQEPDWQDLYRKEKRRAEMWIAKYEKEIGKLEVAVPVAAQPQVEQEPAYLLRDLAADIGVNAMDLISAIRDAGLGDYSINMRLPARVCVAMCQRFSAVEQAPVAWRLRNTAFRSEVYEYFKTKFQAESRQMQFNMSCDDGGLHGLTPLYTRPQPKRKPLTNEQIKKMLDNCDDGQKEAEVALAFARAIERAHGIEGQA